ncbi:MAG: hypothetical protein AB7C98_11450 [Acidithiobacillus sp.]
MIKILKKSIPLLFFSLAAGCGMPGPHFNHVAKADGHSYLSKVLYKPDMGGIGGPCSFAGLSTINTERECRAGQIIETSGPGALFAVHAAYQYANLPFPSSGNMRHVEDFLQSDKVHHSHGSLVMGGLDIAAGDQIMNDGNFGGVGTGSIVLGALSVLSALGGGSSGRFVPGYEDWRHHDSITATRNYPNYNAAKQAMIPDILWAEKTAAGQLQQEGSRLVGKNALWAPGKAFYDVSSPVYGVVFQGRITNPKVLSEQPMLPHYIWTENLKPITAKKDYALTVTWVPVGKKYQNVTWAESETKTLSTKEPEWIFVTRKDKGHAWVCRNGSCRDVAASSQPVIW